MLTKLEVAAIYAGVNLLLLAYLGFRVTGFRRAHKVVIGDGGHAGLQQAIRVHGNAAEYIPAGIAGLLFLSLLNPVALWVIHLAGGALTAGRLLHAYGYSANPGVTFGRLAGMVLTFAALLICGAGLIWSGVAPLI